MMPLRPVRLAFALSVVSLAAGADLPNEPVNMDEFSYGSELSSADAAIRRIELQPVVIRDIQRRDQRDIRVYDANNVAMPSALMKKDGPIRSSRVNLDISAEYLKGKISAYVIDRGNDQVPVIDSLKLAWKTGHAPNILTFYIEHSTNRKSWQTLVNSARVINFDFKGVRLELNEIDINKTTKRYLRFVPIDDKIFPPLAGVTATLTSLPHSDAWWLPVSRLHADDSRPGHYQFEITTGVRPVQFKLSFPAINSLMNGTLYSYAESDAKSRTVFTKDFEAYAVTLNQKVVNARPVDISHSSSTRWEIATTQTLNIDTEHLPSIMAAYPRYQLIFASDGDEPYTLVWGNGNADTNQASDLDARIKAGRNSVNEFPEVRTGVILDNSKLAALVASRRKLWPVILSVLALLTASIAMFIGYKRYRKSR